MITIQDLEMMKQDEQTKIKDWSVPVVIKTGITYSATDELGAILTATSTSTDYTVNAIVRNKSEFMTANNDNKSKYFLPEGIIEKTEYLIFVSVRDIEQLGLTLSYNDIIVYNGIEHFVNYISKNRHEYSIAIGLKK